MIKSCKKCGKKGEGDIGKFSYDIACKDKVLVDERYDTYLASMSHEKTYEIYTDTIKLGNEEIFICNACINKRGNNLLIGSIVIFILIFIPLLFLLLYVIRRYIELNEGIYLIPLVSISLIVSLTILVKNIINYFSILRHKGYRFKRILDKMAIDLCFNEIIKSKNVKSEMIRAMNMNLGSRIITPEEKSRRLKFWDRYMEYSKSIHPDSVIRVRYPIGR